MRPRVLMVMVAMAGGVSASFAAGARAALVYERVDDHAIVAARDDGQEARVIAHGRFPIVSPDGAHVVYDGGCRNRVGFCNEIRLVSVRGGASRLLVRDGVSENPAATWSPNGRCVAVASGGRPGLWLIDLGRRLRRRFIAVRENAVAVFSPTSSEVLIGDFAVSSTGSILQEVLDVRGDHVKTLRADCDFPLLWTPAGFVHAAGDNPGSNAEVLLGARKCAHGSPVLQGGVVGASRNGEQLLISYARPPSDPASLSVTQVQPLIVDVASRSVRGLPEPVSGLVAFSSKGSELLAQIGSQTVVIDVASGRSRVVAQDAQDVTWSG